ncbi:hypothetical protein C3F09_07590 [candidate division GN15 bacterium]|uniref:Uncharacterized protein n=1 Tax=candidate division GN15 bacterium TaxID=2072418 RepID=A0A855X216_9BACT|nr:MAG: hypothetical protein C3F09_07590 [candidate division GN15 bacterium]
MGLTNVAFNIALIVFLSKRKLESGSLTRGRELWYILGGGYGTGPSQIELAGLKQNRPTT